jgi:hypothetical protein
MQLSRSLILEVRLAPHVRAIHHGTVRSYVGFRGNTGPWGSGQLLVGLPPFDLLFSSPLLRRRKRDKKVAREKFINEFNAVP